MEEQCVATVVTGGRPHVLRFSSQSQMDRELGDTEAIRHRICDGLAKEI